MKRKKIRWMQMSFVLTLLAIGCVIPMIPTKTADAATGSISASVRYVMISGSTGSTTITRSASGCSTVQVYVNMDNTWDKLMCQGGPSGSSSVGWIQKGHSYVFKLYAGTDRTELLDTVTVIGIGSSDGTIGARETEVIIPSGQTLGTAEITFGVNGYSVGQLYVKHNGNETLMSQYATGTSTAGWIQDGHKYEFKLYAGTGHTNLLDTVTVYGRKYEYVVGANYHATGTDFNTTSFLRDYHITSVRNTVKSQLQGMANAGATNLKLGMWMTVTSGTPTEKWKWHFPPTAQELTNLRTYAQDVAAIQATDGHRLHLDIEMYWIWASNYTVGSPSTTLGNENLSPSVFTSKITSTYQGIINKVYNVCRPDGKKVVSSVSFANEIMSAKANTVWFLTTHYPGFVTYCNNKGLTPTIEVNISYTSEQNIMNPNWIDYGYPLLNGHGAMYWPYRTLKLFVDNNLHIPDRINFSVYTKGESYSQSALIKKIFDDADAVLPSLGVRKYYAVTEQYYLPDNSAREALGAALCEERLRNNRLTLVQFWNTPYNSGWPATTAPPYDFADYLP